MRRLAIVVTLLAVLVAVAAVGWASRSDDEVARPDRSTTVVPAPVTTLSCPESPTDKQTATDLLAVAPIERPAELGSEASDSGNATEGEVRTLTPDEPRRIARLGARGVPVERALTTADQPSVVVAAAGDGAPGLAATQWSTASKDAGTGLAVSTCAPADDDWWFAGVTTAVGATTRLVVSNPTPAVAEFDLTFYGPGGVEDAVGARGLAVAPMSAESYDLALFTPGVDSLAVHVEVESGRLAAAVHTEQVAGADPVGSEWVPPTTAPATEVLVNAGFAEDTDQELQIVNPTESEALVEVQVVDPDGPFAPTKLADLRVPPGSVLTKRLTAVNEEEATAVQLTSTVDVIGAISESSEDAADIAVASAGPELDAPAVVPLIPDHDLAIAFTSAVRTAGDVTVTAYDGNGEEVDREDFNLKGFTTTVWEPSGKVADRAAYLVVVAAPEGRTHAVVQYSAKDAIASVPVVPGVYTLDRPSVRPAAP